MLRQRQTKGSDLSHKRQQQKNKRQMIALLNRFHKRHTVTRSNQILLMIIVWVSCHFSRAASRSFGNLTTASVLQKVFERHVSQSQLDSTQMRGEMNVLDSFENSVSRNLQFFHRTEPVSSTQDEMRSLLKEKSQLECVALVATIQTAGRGTQGRAWKAASGNLYLTVALPWPQIPVPITLLPLQVGIAVAQRVHAILSACCTENIPKVSLKWPNDVLVDDAKVSGCLIESYSNDRNLTWFLVGIGVNVAQTPQLQGLPGQHKRAPTSIYEWCNPEKQGWLSSQSIASVLGLDIANALADWVAEPRRLENKDGQYVVNEWRKWAEFGKPYELRGSVVDEDQGGFEGETVVTVDIEADGQLRVRDQNSRERLLVADYLV